MATDTEPSLDEVYRANAVRLRRIAYLMTGSAAVADELANEAFLRLHERWHGVDEPAAYVRVVLVNLCRRWQRRVVTRPDESVAAADLVVSQPEVDETWALLQHLPDEQRAVVVLRYYEDLATAEIAELLGCAEATVRTRLHRALARLRKEMTP